MIKMGCESCETGDVQWNLTDVYEEKVKYKVCSTCLMFLTTHSLPKDCFKNLIKNGHKTSEFLLHEDFYDNDGNALQPVLRR